MRALLHPQAKVNLTSQPVETSDVKEYRFQDNGVKYVLVDTPGFNDTYQSDQVITTKILQWLESSYRNGALLNGVVYLHRLSDPRMGGKALSNLFMFRRLCGPNALENVVLATTFWEGLSQSDLESREAELINPKKDFWARMVAKGSQVKRLGLDRESGLRIVREIANNHKVVFQAQVDIVNQGVNIQDVAHKAITASQLDSLTIEILEGEKRWDEQIQDQRKTELDHMKKILEQQEEDIRRCRREQDAESVRLEAEIQRRNRKLQRDGDCDESDKEIEDDAQHQNASTSGHEQIGGNEPLFIKPSDFRHTSGSDISSIASVDVDIFSTAGSLSTNSTVSIRFTAIDHLVGVFVADKELAPLYA